MAKKNIISAVIAIYRRKRHDKATRKCYERRNLKQCRCLALNLRLGGEAQFNVDQKLYSLKERVGL